MESREASSAPVPSDEEVIAEWGQVIRGFSVTNKKLHVAVAAAFNLDEPETETMLRLGSSPLRRVPMTVLAREAAFSSGGFTKVADRLARRQLVQRSPGANDRRITYLELTPAGEEMAAGLHRLVADVVRSIYVDILGAERAAVVASAMRDLRKAHRDVA
ncbi:winged helix DNA-binding protein [Arthrobacter sp. MSA 4-2]|uniref:MarR family winged helix-turn-helix transcriptional regulator n=1 Tax=Arthrobacter sp. MSA 4-2 TaxID=2794349 RepID=UPI0018E8072A|nr:winged helix DNA-binding protein [Arthrobacter sp. MSA 4-2]MBJ2122423.1 winged helix DNA-binding protein [Arthrobacter sp. MSA 4-2]